MNRKGGRDSREHPTEVLGVGGVLGGQARTNRDAESGIPPLTHPKTSFLPSVHTPPHTHTLSIQERIPVDSFSIWSHERQPHCQM